MTNRGHCRIKPPLTTTIIDKMNKAINKTIIYHEKEMVIKTAISQKAKDIKIIITSLGILL